ncbi:terpene synthase family protein [Amycolatopsis panacis]|uniref:Terpene synthase n=1 Tax=Amycolatopsis panacis TaxID=2340917 RepID=A0A419I4S0_9PSEU|nr:terpene synthase [Amycolatopsis panacis]RJQ85486.1 terpene synthase [Amycolatopsis panacis]
MPSTPEEQLYARFADLPRPSYPFEDLVNPAMEDLVQECSRWIDDDYGFHSEKARSRHKQHRLTDIAARGFPYLTLPELRPVARFASSGAMLDDYFDHADHGEMGAIRKRIMALLSGAETVAPQDLGIYRQFQLIRQDARLCGMPEHLYRKFVIVIGTLLAGFQDEKRYIARNQPAPLPVLEVIRAETSGGLPFAKYLCMQKDYRALPDEVLEHPIVLRLHLLASRMIGWHNDIISLPKELSRKGDVINLVITLQHEHGVSIEDAYRMAVDFHDRDLDEFITLQDNLPVFGKWQRMAQEYVTDLGAMLQGVYSWHIKNSSRYRPGAYVEPEYASSEFVWRA